MTGLPAHAGYSDAYAILACAIAGLLLVFTGGLAAFACVLFHG
jgi:hypothetical protein